MQQQSAASSNEFQLPKAKNGNRNLSTVSTKQVVLSSRDLIEVFNRGNADSHTNSERNEGMISCPLCGRGIIVEDENEETKNNVMNKHIDRCSRVMQIKEKSKGCESTSSTLRRGPAALYKEDLSVDEFEDSGSEECIPKAKNDMRKRLNKGGKPEKAVHSKGKYSNESTSSTIKRVSAALYKEDLSFDEFDDSGSEEYKPKAKNDLIKRLNEEGKPEKAVHSKSKGSKKKQYISSDESSVEECRPRKKSRSRKSQSEVPLDVVGMDRSSSSENLAAASKVEGEVEDQNEFKNVTVSVVSDDWETQDYEMRLSELDAEYVDTDFGGRFYAPSWEKLFEYQKQGCRWLFDLYQEGVGGILGDEMGAQYICYKHQFGLFIYYEQSVLSVNQY